MGVQLGEWAALSACDEIAEEEANDEKLMLDHTCLFRLTSHPDFGLKVGYLYAGLW
jgi:hypothetical protein